MYDYKDPDVNDYFKAIAPRRQECCTPEHVWLTVKVSDLVYESGITDLFTGEDPDIHVETVHFLVDLALTHSISRNRIATVLRRTGAHLGSLTMDGATMSLGDFEIRLLEIRGEWDRRVNTGIERRREWHHLRRAFSRVFTNARCTGEFCEQEGCCAGAGELLRRLGVTVHEGWWHVFEWTRLNDTSDDDSEDDDANDDEWFEHGPRATSLPQRDEREDILLLLGGFRLDRWQNNPDIFEGYLEIPRVIADIIHERGWYDRLRTVQDLHPDDPMRRVVLEDFIEILVNDAFTDEYLEELRWLGPR